MNHTARPLYQPGVLHELTSRRLPDQPYYLYLPATYPANGHPAKDGHPVQDGHPVPADPPTLERFPALHVAAPGLLRQPFRLLVTIHGQSRGAMRYAEGFTTFADQHRYVVLAPLFGQSIRYQELGIGGERADLRLLELVDEVAADVGIDAGQFDLFGYSGGAQFAHRFLYVQPDRLGSVVIGAPGTITLPTERERWPVGIGGLAKTAGTRVNLEAVRRPRVLLLVGSEDTTLDGLNQSPWAMRAGATRLGRARSLHASWLVAGIEHTYLEVPEASHGLEGPIVEEACRFLAAGR